MHLETGKLMAEHTVFKVKSIGGTNHHKILDGYCNISIKNKNGYGQNFIYKSIKHFRRIIRAVDEKIIG